MRCVPIPTYFIGMYNNVSISTEHYYFSEKNNYILPPSGGILKAISTDN